VEKHFVTFYSPGTFVAETTAKQIDSWDVNAAVEMAHKVTERYGATPYGFRFSTRTRGPDDLDSVESACSPMHYLGGKVETLDEVKARATDKDQMLIANMEGNGWNRIITNDNSWRFTQPLHDDDIVLDFTPKTKIPD
jgi:hypothetical protein